MSRSEMVRIETEYPAATRGRLVVWGMLGRYPFGGVTWQVLHHLIALRRLGFDVWYVEDSDRFVSDPETYSRTPDCSANISYIARQMDAIGLGDRWLFRAPGSTTWFGAESRLKRFYAETDVALNICGAQELLPHHAQIKSLIYLQTDPVLAQIKVAQGDPKVIAELDAYDCLFTYGLNLENPDCIVPVERYNWQPTTPPVCIDLWATEDSPAPGSALTTVGNWKSSSGRRRVWNGVPLYHYKGELFRSLADLPLRTKTPLELCVGRVEDHEAKEMRAHGWRVIDAKTVSEPGAYRAYIQASLGEFTVAKEDHRLRTGWFSDRSVCYLASGRPVVTQDTAFGCHLPVGEGLLPYRTEDEALLAIEEISGNYERHSKAASEIAREYFDAERILGDIFRTVGLL